MVRKKKLSPSGLKGEDGKYHNVHLSLNEDELEAAGLKVGDEVFVRVRENVLIVEKAEKAAIGEQLNIRRKPAT